MPIAFEEIETIIRGNVFCSVCLLTSFQVVFFLATLVILSENGLFVAFSLLCISLCLNYRRLNLLF